MELRAASLVINSYRVTHVRGQLEVSSAVGVVQISGEVETGRSEVSVVFLLLHALAADL